MTDRPSRGAEDARRRRIEKGQRQEAKARQPGLQSMMELPLLELLAEKGGSARPRDLYAEMAERLNLDPQAREETRKGGDQEYTVFDQQVRWTRQTLVAKELVAGERGIWELTDKGREKLTRINRGKTILVYSLDNGLAFLAHAEEAAEVIAPESVSLILTSPPYPVVGREYGRFSVPDWLQWMSGLVGMWKNLLTEDGTLAVNLMDVFVPGSPMISPYVERFTLDALDRHGLHLAGRMPWHSNNKLGNIEWTVKRRQALRNTMEHVLLFSKNGLPSWDIDRLPKEPYAERTEAQKRSDAARASKKDTRRRPGGYDLVEEAFARNGEGRIPSNLIVSGGTGGSGHYGKRCKEAGLDLHPARFPEELPKRVILLATDKNDTVYDPMAGSNTTGKVALELGRRFISSEPVLEYVQGSALRFNHLPDFREYPIAA